MADTIKTLVEQLSTYSPGDLVTGIEIKEMCDRLAEEASCTDDQKTILKEVSQFFEASLMAGSETDAAEKVEAFRKKIESNFEISEIKDTEEKKKKTADEGDYEVLFSFIQEAQDHLENIEEEILKLEDSDEPDLVDSIFRSMHTIKGVSSFLGLNKIKTLSHSLESVLDELRKETITINTDLVDILLEGTDLVKAMVAELSSRSEDLAKTKQPVTELDSEMEIDHIVTSLGKIITDKQAPQVSAQADQVITPEMIEKFVEESGDLLDRFEEYIKQLQSDPGGEKAINDAFRTMHTIKGNAGFFGYSRIESISVDIETVIDSIRRGNREAESGILEIILDSVDAIRKQLVLIRQGETDFEEPEKPETEQEYLPLGEALVAMGGVTQQAVEEALELQQRKLGEILVEEGAVSQDVLEEALQKQNKAKKEPQDQGASYKTQRSDIRVDMEKLDSLFDLMGELITAEAMVIDNPDLEQYELDAFDTATSYLSKITREMQEITMTIRMIPLEGLFNKMRRLVRDLSRKFEKKINLTISGQDTEMDRNVMEEISDPLVHIIRNAIDHGIEAKAAREQAGKEETGAVHLSARYEGNEIWISVKDDGGGLHRDKIIDKANENNLLRSDPSSMTDKEVWNLIFEPGFSTADKVSEISGRGVGMDVVKRNIEKLRGKIDISSTPGKGTEIILRIPLTLAIIDGVSLLVGSRLFSLPINDVVSFHKIEEGQLTTTKQGEEVLRLRDDIIPVIKLHDFYSIDTEKKAATDGIVLVILADGKYAAVVVDKVVGYKQIVVKALPDYIGDMKAISGCSIMGNGDVSLIIDTNSLVNAVIE
jgi:two-component system, chemotaxis family, sensor kinase CheA